MLTEQKQLLADVQIVTNDALKLYNRGVKISGVVRNLRAAGSELETRVRALERAAKAEKPAPRKPSKKETAPEAQPQE